MNTVFLDFQTFSEQTNLDAIALESDNLTVHPLTQPSEVIEHCKEADVIVTNKVQLTKQVLADLPKLKLICVAATGTNNVDIDAAKEHGIAVTNVSGYSTPSVSQYVFAQLLRLFSRPDHHATNVETGLWQQSPSFVYHGQGMEELAGKTLTIVGYGNLGQSVATIAQAFGMKVLIAERHDSTNVRDNRTEFKSALAQADIVSFHCPLTPETEGLVNKGTIALMKNTAVLINTSRGPVVNEADLKEALENKQLGHAILDVLVQEPPTPDYPLLQRPPQNLTITAHIAWASFEAQQRLINLIGKNIQDFKTGLTTNRVDI